MEFITLLSNFLSKFLFDEGFQVGFVINYKYFGSHYIAANFVFNKLKSTGLVRKSSARSWVAVWYFSSSPYAVIIITTGGGLWYFCLITASNSSPLIPGMLISERISTASCSN